MINQGQTPISVDEMAHAWVDVTYLNQADYERLLAERKAKQPALRP